MVWVAQTLKYTATEARQVWDSTKGCRKGLIQWPSQEQNFHRNDGGK